MVRRHAAWNHVDVIGLTWRCHHCLKVYKICGETINRIKKHLSGLPEKGIGISVCENLNAEEMNQFQVLFGLVEPPPGADQQGEDLHALPEEQAPINFGDIGAEGPAAEEFQDDFLATFGLAGAEQGENLFQEWLAAIDFDALAGEGPAEQLEEGLPDGPAAEEPVEAEPPPAEQREEEGPAAEQQVEAQPPPAEQQVEAQPPPAEQQVEAQPPLPESPAAFNNQIGAILPPSSSNASGSGTHTLQDMTLLRSSLEEVILAGRERMNDIKSKLEKMTEGYWTVLQAIKNGNPLSLGKVLELKGLIQQVERLVNINH